MFRAHFLYIWLVMNALFGVISTLLVSGSNVKVLNDGSITFLDGFALFVASLVAFKFIFALIYTLKWNLRLCCKSYYQKNKIDVGQEFKRLKKTNK